MIYLLPETFEKKGNNYRMIACTERGYLYEVSHSDVKNPWYEVFKRKLTDTFSDFETKTLSGDQKEMIPGDESFGVWAWTFNELERADSKLFSL